METGHIIKVSVYENCATIRCSICTLINTSTQFELISAYPDANLILENCTYRKPDVVIMDIEMPGISGIEASRILQMHFPDIKVIMLTVLDDNENVFQSVCTGAVGYILKNSYPAEILAAIICAYEGGAPMTPVIALKVINMVRSQIPQREVCEELSEREHKILTLLTKGYSYKMIASECEISIDTVRFHIKKIYEKLQVHSMTEAVSKALKNKWV